MDKEQRYAIEAAGHLATAAAELEQARWRLSFVGDDVAGALELARQVEALAALLELVYAATAAETYPKAPEAPHD